MHSDISDLTLLKAWQRHRDAEAFHTIVQRHARLVYNTCRHILRNDTDAADVSQECFLCLAATPPEIAHSLSGWLHRVATHRSLDHLKASNRRRDREIRYARETVVAGEVEQADMLAMVDEAIDTLPDDLRLPLVEHFFGQKTHQKVAQELGIPRRTVSYRINSGIEQLRATLNNRGVVAPVAGLTALLEWQRAEAVALPKGLNTTLSKFAIAGTASPGARPSSRSALALPPFSRSALLFAAFMVIVFVTLWLMPSHFSAPTEIATVALNNAEDEDLSAGDSITSIKPDTAESAEREPVAAGVAQAQVAGGKVTGRVYDAETDAPIPGATVKIAMETDTYNPVATCTTDAEGHYATEALRPGAYMIYRGETPGYGATSEWMENAGTRLTRAELDGIRFRLTKNTTINLPVNKGLVVSGVVVDSLGNGIANATVSARTRRYNNGQTTKTNADGTFFLAGFHSTNALCMSVHKPGFGNQNFSNMEISFPGLENLRIEMTESARVTGSVIRADGKPMANAHVMAFHGGAISKWPLAISEDYTDTEGNFSIGDLGPDRYGLQVFSGNYKRLGTGPIGAYVDVAAGEHIDGVVIKTEDLPGIAVSGIVTEPDGTPIENQVITLNPATTRTGAGGRFSMRGVQPGQRRVETELNGYRPGYQQVGFDGPVTPDMLMRRWGLVDIDDDHKDVHIVLYRNTFTLTGRVLDAASGEAIKYFEIFMVNEHGAVPLTLENWPDTRRVFSDDGAFRLENLPLGPGPWSVLVRVPGFGVGSSDLSISPEMTEADVTIAVQKGLTVSGTVVDCNNRPVEGVEILMGPPLECRVATTGTDGTFRATGLPTNVELGEPQRGLYAEKGLETLTAFHPRYPLASAPIPKSKDNANVLFRFGKAGSIVVRINRDGRPVTVANVSASISSEKGTLAIGSDSRTVGRDGTAIFNGVVPGLYLLHIQAAPGEGAPVRLEQTVEVTSGKSTYVQVELGGKSATLNGTYLVDGEAVERAYVTFETTNDDGPVVASSLIDPADGVWQLLDVSASSGTLTFESTLDSVNVARSLSLALKPGEARTIDIDHGSAGDEAEEIANLHGTLETDGIVLRQAWAVYTFAVGDVSISYTKTIYGQRTEQTAQADTIRIAPDRDSADPLIWSLEGIAAGTGTLTIKVSDATENEYKRVVETTLDAEEELYLDMRLTSDDLVVSGP